MRVLLITILNIFIGSVISFAQLSGGAVLFNSLNYPVGEVATAARVPQGGTSSNVMSMSKTRHIARTSINGNLQIEYPNWYLNYLSANSEGGPGGTATISASIEYPIGVTLTQVKWSGSATHTISSGAEGALSDPINVSIPNGSAFFIKTYVNSTSSTVFEIANSGTGVSILDTGNGEEYHSAVSGLTDQTMVLGPITGGSTITTRRFGPIAIVAPTSQASLILIGDSRVYGINDSFTSTSGDKGELERPIGPLYAYTNISQPGNSLLNFIASHTNTVALANKYYSSVVLELGVNDIIANSQSAAQVTTSYNTALSYFITPNVYLITLPPDSSSTDSWATLVNQTTNATNNIRVSVNTSNLTRSGFAGCIDFNSIAEDSGLVGKWIVNGSANTYTSDGLHESQTMNLLYVSSGIVTSTTFRRYKPYP